MVAISTFDAPLHYCSVTSKLMGLHNSRYTMQLLFLSYLYTNDSKYTFCCPSLSLPSFTHSHTVMDNKGKTALFHCLHPTNRHIKCLDFLLECGADPNTLVIIIELKWRKLNTCMHSFHHGLILVQHTKCIHIMLYTCFVTPK